MVDDSVSIIHGEILAFGEFINFLIEKRVS